VNVKLMEFYGVGRKKVRLSVPVGSSVSLSSILFLDCVFKILDDE